jgi:cellobiose epimerase
MFLKLSKNFIPIDACRKQTQQSGWRPETETLQSIRTILEKILMSNIVPFWYPAVIDNNDGGYRLNHDFEGRWQGRANKYLVTQARTLWFFSRMFKSKYATGEYLAAATHGFDFLSTRMLDKEFGGFYWEVGVSGHPSGGAQKQMYGQAFALYSLTEYAAASGDPLAKQMATELFSLLETRGHDTKHGGYRDILQRDWNPVLHRSTGKPEYAPDIKRMNTHLHLLEAMTSYYALTEDPRARQRLVELIVVNSNSVVRKNIGACSDKYLENWQPLQGRDYRRVSYGHDVENIWLLIQSCKIAGISQCLLMDLYRTLFEYALRYGFDRKDGGFFDSGVFEAPADRREKIWWVQAEGLLACLQMYELTRERLYWDCFTLVLQWIIGHQVDWHRGEWYETIDDKGRASGVKAGPWKGPYHNGRAVLQCLNLLDVISASKE